jgi:uncharacterized membrane protein
MATENSSNYDHLAEKLGTETADAIRGLAREEALAVIDDLREEVQHLVQRQQGNIEASKQGGSKDASGVNDATRAVQDADASVKAAAADPTPEKQADASSKVEKAEKSVSELESDNASKQARIDQLEAEQRDTDTQGSWGPSALVIGAVTFIVALVVLLIAAIFSPFTVWDAFWTAVGAAIITTVVMAILDDWGVIRSRVNRKSKNKDKSDDAGLEVLNDRREHEHSSH